MTNKDPSVIDRSGTFEATIELCEVRWSEHKNRYIQVTKYSIGTKTYVTLDDVLGVCPRFVPGEKLLLRTKRISVGVKKDKHFTSHKWYRRVW